MNMKQLKYVQVIAEVGSFAGAAESLGISQPSLSQYVKKIESQVGMELFDRTGGYVRLTDAGRIYVEAGRKILDLEHQMQNSFSDIACHKTGSVIVGTSPYRSAAFMPSAVRAFRELYPGMHVVIEEMTSAELVEEASRGRFDICLTLGPCDERVFKYETVDWEELVLAVPASEAGFKTESVPDRRYPAIEASQLNGRNFVMLTETQYMQKTLDNMCEDYGLKLKTAAVVKSLEAQIAMVRAGVGMALVSSGIEHFCSEGEVRFYSFVQDLPRRQVVALWKRDRQLSTAAGSLLDILKKQA